MGRKQGGQFQKLPVDEQKQLDASRGTPLWAFNTFRSTMLSSILNGIMEKENEGLQSDHCKMVRMFLGKLVHLSSDLPDGSFLKGSIFSEMAKFEKLYIEWNDIEGDNPYSVTERRRLLSKLRKRRKSISNRVRHNQYVIMNELDLHIIDSTYKAIGELVEALPNVMIDLSKQYNAYLRKKEASQSV